jgi:hypothetical protein
MQVLNDLISSIDMRRILWESTYDADARAVEEGHTLHDTPKLLENLFSSGSEQLILRAVNLLASEKNQKEGSVQKRVTLFEKR